MGDALGPKRTFWTCSNCGQHNPTSHPRCSVCNCKKEDAEEWHA